MKTELLKDITNNKEEGEHLDGNTAGVWRWALSPEGLRCAPMSRAAPFTSCLYSQQGSSPEDANLVFSPSISTCLKNTDLIFTSALVWLQSAKDSL